MDPKWLQKMLWRKAVFATFSRPCLLCWIWLLAPVVSLLAPFGSLLAPFGSLLAPFLCPWAHFWSPWRSIFSLFVYPGGILNIFSSFRWTSYVKSYFLKSPHWNSIRFFFSAFETLSAKTCNSSFTIHMHITLNQKLHITLNQKSFCQKKIEINAQGEKCQNGKVSFTK